MFAYFKKAIQEKIDFLIENSTTLFEVETNKEELWNLYLDSFPSGTNEVYRENRQHDCDCCKAFIRHYGSIVGIVDGKLISIWDIQVEHPFKEVAQALNDLIVSLPISDIFLTDEIYGKDSNYDVNRPEHPKYDHLYYSFPADFIRQSIASQKGQIRQTKEVIKRSLEELNPSSVDIVLDLIADKAIYRGEEYGNVLRLFKDFQKPYILSKSKDHYCWEVAVKHQRKLAIRNTAIGTLLIDISNGVDLQEAVDKFGKVMDPANFKRVKPVFSAKMKKDAEDFVKQKGLMSSLSRRHAMVPDISIHNVLWASGESKEKMKTPFDLITSNKGGSAKEIANIEEVGVDFFIENILPSAKTIELKVSNSHQNNFVSLIAPSTPNTPSLFHWQNGFSWAYSGDFTDSIKQKVKAHGGKVDGVFRASLSWADNDDDNSDLDLHCLEPNGNLIYFSNKGIVHPSSGSLDVDIVQPSHHRKKGIVENITYANLSKMPVGEYHIMVNNYALRGNQKGFTVEIEFDGTIRSFVYITPLKNHEKIKVATVAFDGKKFNIVKSIKSNQISQEVWGVPTLIFAPVQMVMLSPNHWEGENKKGNKHYFFALKDCLNPDSPRGFFNEFLRHDLIPHKRVFEALGSKMKVQYSENQLSGLGFSSTMNNSVVLKINSKPIKINFTDDKLISKSSKKKVPFSNQ